KARPLVIDRDRSALTAADGKPYAGCYVNATIDIWAMDNNFGKRINASLGGVQFLCDGDAFAGGGVATPDDFENMSEGADAEALI
uniref:ssDNA-binding protein n=1 Tax=Candidatus Symbiopectobacterium sp. TaxID=2816440 RepID=UPI0025B91E9B